MKYWLPHLKFVGDRVTGSTDEDHREYILDDVTDIQATVHKAGMGIQSEANTCKADTENLKSLFDDLQKDTPGSSSDGAGA